MKEYSRIDDIPKKPTQYIVSIDNEYRPNILNENNKPTNEIIYNKKFIVFEKMKAYKDYINKKDYHAYEVITAKNRKIYFDIDKVDLTYNECIIYLEKFYKVVSELLNINYDTGDWCILINDTPHNKINSIHIININYSLDYKENHKLAEYINLMGGGSSPHDTYKGFKGNIPLFNVDLKVYSVRQQFRHFNQSKINKGIRFKYLYEGFKFNHSLISNTKYTKLLTFDRGFIEDTTKEIINIDEVELMNILLNDNAYNKLFNINKYWVIITQVIYKLNLMNINEWCKLSVERATNDYNYEDNLKYIEKLKGYSLYNPLSCGDETPHLNISLMSFYNIINKLSVVNYQPIYKLPQTITHYIDNNFKDSKKIKDLIYKEHKNPIMTENGLLDCYNGFLTKDGITKNIFYDFINLPTEKLFNTIETIDEAEIKLNEFLKSDLLLYAIKSRWGTGKTHKIINNAIKSFEEDGGSILLITESNALNNKLKKDYNFVSHLDKQQNKEIDLNKCNKVVCSIQSINKIEKRNFNLVIIDEFESVLNSYLSYTTFKNVNTSVNNYNEYAYKLLLNKIKNSYKTLCLDADIEEAKIKLFVDIYGNDKIVSYNNKQNPFKEYKFILLNEYDYTLYKFFEDYKQGLKLVMAWITSKDKLEEVLIKMFEGRQTNILYINVEGVFLYKNGIKTTYEKEFIIPNIEEFIIKEKVQVWIYTPTIKTGISFNSLYFDKCYGVSNHNTLICKEFLQALFRVRQLRNKEINIFIEHFKLFTTNKKIKCNVSLNEVKRLFKTNENLYSELSKSRVDNMYFTNNTEGDYFDLQSVNTQNAINSVKNYTYNFVSLLKYHGLNYTYEINGEDNEEYNLTTDYDKKVIEWYKLSILSFGYFQELQKQNQDKFKSVSIEERQTITKQYNKTLHLLQLFKTYDKIPHHLHGNFYGEYDEETEEYTLTKDYKNFYTHYFIKKKSNTLRLIRNLIYDKVDMNELQTIMNVDNTKLDMLILHNLNNLFDYTFKNNYISTKKILHKKINDNMDLFNEMYKRYSKTPYNTTDKIKIINMIKHYYKLIDIDFTETDTTFTIETNKESKTFNYKYINRQLKQSTIEIYLINNDNTEHLNENKLNEYIFKLENNKPIRNIAQVRQNIYNNLIMNEYYVNINKDNTYNFVNSFTTLKPTITKQKIPFIKIIEKKNIYDKISDDKIKSGYVNIGKKKYKVYENNRLYPFKQPTINPIKKATYNLNELYAEYKLYTHTLALINNHTYNTNNLILSY